MIKSARTFHRRDIDGLRAVAVSAVVLFHAGVSQIGSGFVGVDIFFVISGYLIGGIVLQGCQDKTFTFRDFYARRARRILPALFTVVGAVLTFGWIYLGSDEFEKVGATCLSSLIGTSNISYWRHQDYFDVDARLSPMLMTWSLGVEEQFYLVFPFLIAGMIRWWPKNVLAGLLLATTASFMFSYWCTWAYPTAAFYLLPSRAWELGCGAALVTWQRAREEKSQLASNPRFVHTVALAGVLSLAIAIFSFDDATPFPGLLALLPTAGTIALLWSKESWINKKILSAAPFAFIGKVSYSWYLWHWPVMSFIRIISVNDPTEWTLLAGAGISFLLAILSWAFVEQPFRRSSVLPSTLLYRYGALLFLFVLVSASVKVFSGYPQRLSPQALKIEEMVLAGRGDCLASFKDFEPAHTALCSAAGDNSESVAIVGDSHAAALGAGIRVAAEKAGFGVSIFAKSSCGPLLGVLITHRNMPFFGQACSSFMEKSFKEIIADPKIKIVILAGDWASYSRLSPELLSVGLSFSLESLINAGKQVEVMGDVPAWQIDPVHVERAANNSPRLRAAEFFWSNEDGNFPTSGKSRLTIENNSRIESTVSELASRSGAEYRDLRSTFCSGDECIFTIGQDLLYLDRSHLSTAGSRYAIETVGLFKSTPHRDTAR